MRDWIMTSALDQLADVATATFFAGPLLPVALLAAGFATAAFFARYAAQRFFVASPIRFRAAALIFRLAGDADAVVFRGALMPSFLRISAILAVN
jgi:hypothetical protein